MAFQSIGATGQKKELSLLGSWIQQGTGSFLLTIKKKAVTIAA